MVEFGLVVPAVGGIGAPTGIVATAGTNQISVAFTAPDAVDGVTVTNYAYSTDGGSTWVTRSPAATTSPLVITGLTGGTTYSVALRAIASELASTPVSSVPVSIATVSGTPTVSGTATAGSVLTASASGVTVGGYPTPTNTWKWQRSANGTTGWADISAATAATYTIAEADRTYYLRATYTATNSVGSASASSAATAQVPAAHLLQDDFNRADGAIGTAISGQTWVQISGTWEIVGNRAKALTHVAPNFGRGETGATVLGADAGSNNMVMLVKFDGAAGISLQMCANSTFTAGFGVDVGGNYVNVTRQTGATTQTSITATGGNRQFPAGIVTTSADWAKLVVNSDNILHVYYSTNGGSTWVENTSTWDVAAARAGSYVGRYVYETQVGGTTGVWFDDVIVDAP